MRVLRWIGWGVGGLVALALVVALGLIVADRMGRPPQPDLKALIARGETYDVRIRRDDWGVPHILGKTDADAAYGMGFAQSEDDFATLQDVALATRGQLAALNGPKAAVTDYIVHLLGVWGTIDAALRPRHAGRGQAGAGGLCRRGQRLCRPPSGPGQGAACLPVTGKDLAAGFVFTDPIFYGLDGASAAAATGAARKDDTCRRAPTAWRWRRRARRTGRRGCWSIRTSPIPGPLAWYEAVVESGQGWHVAGGFFPGTPFMLHGHNAHLGWANTVNHPDLVDVYQLSINPAEPEPVPAGRRSGRTSRRPMPRSG